MPDGTVITKHKSTTTKLPTIDINKKASEGGMFKIRIDPSK